MHIRDARNTDIYDLRSLMEQLGYPIDVHELAKNMAHYSKLPHQKVWVVEHEGKVVGCLAAAMTHYFHRPGSFLRVIALVVDQAYRRQGVGKALLQHAEAHARERGCTYLELTSGIHRAGLGSYAFYAAQGFEELSDKKKYFVKPLITP
jgi:N-acetylglutamate synthase-like GNAT family acetyltransferase